MAKPSSTVAEAVRRLNKQASRSKSLADALSLALADIVEHENRPRIVFTSDNAVILRGMPLGDVHVIAFPVCHTCDGRGGPEGAGTSIYDMSNPDPSADICQNCRGTGMDLNVTNGAAYVIKSLVADSQEVAERARLAADDINNARQSLMLLTQVAQRATEIEAHDIAQDLTVAHDGLAKRLADASAHVDWIGKTDTL